jgi:hypothetical protein
VPRRPKGKRVTDESGVVGVASKDPNGLGSVYYEPPTPRVDGTLIGARWRATYVDATGQGVSPITWCRSQ